MLLPIFGGGDFATFKFLKFLWFPSTASKKRNFPQRKKVWESLGFFLERNDHLGRSLFLMLGILQHGLLPVSKSPVLPLRSSNRRVEELEIWGIMQLSTMIFVRFPWTKSGLVS